MAVACGRLLPIAGAGLGLMNDAFRVPLGASDDLASAAERLQFTQGEGRCLDASKHCRLVIAGPVDIEQRWPAFARELFNLTPYRAVISLPLPLEPDLGAALDLYLS